MRSLRWLAVCAILVPAVSSAQTNRGFRNSWFWGVKGGITSFSTETVDNATAPSVGAEWLITRNRFGLYIAGDYHFFDEMSVVAGMNGQPEPVAVSDMKRITLAALVFPKAFGTVRPYAGAGFAVNLINDATPTRQFGPGEELEASFLAQELADRKDRSSVLFMGGVQGQLARVVPFAQVTVQPWTSNFLLNGRAGVIAEAGIRYNFGNAIDRQ
ncbi:MAG TPA: hypothetical protein VFS05_00370 [Gemmatimonadaceae bacterium]|nr:hypothetical protein [Gemmatimonadaceae bacterium]